MSKPECVIEMGGMVCTFHECADCGEFAHPASTCEAAEMKAASRGQDYNLCGACDDRVNGLKKSNE